MNRTNGWKGMAKCAIAALLTILVMAAAGCQSHQAPPNVKSAAASQDEPAGQAANDASQEAATTSTGDADETQAADAAVAVSDSGAPNAVMAMDFENRNMGTWKPRVGGELAISEAAQHSGKYSLEITGRRHTYEGPIIELTPILTSGKSYHAAVWVMYDSGPATHVFQLTDEVDQGGAPAYNVIASATLAKGKWALLQGDFTFSSADAFRIYLESEYKSDKDTGSDDLMPFYIDDFSLADAAAPKMQADIPSLREVMAPYFPIGAAIEPQMLDAADPNNALLIKHYSSLTAGNFMKPDAMEPAEGTFRWSTADKLVQFAQQHKMVVRGHTLLWHNQMPGWYFVDPKDPAKPASRDLLLKRLKTYISTVVGHYKGKVQYWDVVNEVVSDSSDGLRGESEGSHWTSIVGDVNGDGSDDDFIRLAFQYAHEADPDAKLVINDYNIAGTPSKQDAMYHLLKRLLAQGTPIHAIGMQLHSSIYGPDAQTVKDAIERFAALGLKVEVTEMDMSIYRWGENQTKEASQAILMQQAKQYRDLFDVFREEAKKGNLESVTLWGSADNDTWLDNFPVKGRTDAPLLFDRKLQAKPAFWAIVDPSKIGLSEK